MSCDFKPTSVTLLQRIAIERTGEDEATRVRFWELYQPAMLMSAKITEEAYRRKVDVTVTMAALAGE